MEHVKLTCKNHPDLRWQCKSIAFTEGKGYNGQRHIFFEGIVRKENAPRVWGWDVIDGELVNTLECDCPPSDLIKCE